MAKYKPYGLKGSMVSILFVIGKKRGINQKTLSEMLMLDPSTMSRDIKKLIGKDWITIRKGEDSRHSQLELTKSGCKLLEEIAPIWNEIHTKVQAILGEFNIMQIDNITAAIKENINDLKE